jgi:hypothetical protein
LRRAGLDEGDGGGENVSPTTPSSWWLKSAGNDILGLGFLDVLEITGSSQFNTGQEKRPAIRIK